MAQEIMQIDETEFAGGPIAAFGQLDPNSESLADGIGQSYGVLGYKGKEWTLRLRGETYSIPATQLQVKNQLGQPITVLKALLDCVILAQAPNKSRSYFVQYDQSNEREKPLCTSMDGVTPDAGVLQRQSPTCAMCEKRKRKPDARGKMSSECTEYKRLAVLINPNITQAIFGEPVLEPIFLRVPPASLNSLALMGETMKNRGYHFNSFITRISFKEGVSWPQMEFSAIARVKDPAVAAEILRLANDPVTRRIVFGDLPQALSSIAAPITTTATGISGSTPITFALPASGNGNQQTPLPAASSPLSTSGSGGASVARDTKPTPNLIDADSGVTTESDGALDDRIAALMDL